MKKKVNSKKVTQLAITTFAVLILIVHYRWPTIAIDGISIILIVVAVIPWLIPLFKSLEFPGGWKVEFKEEKDLEAEAKAKAEKAYEQSVSLHQTEIKWDKVATLFWLGNDLMWLQDRTYRVFPPEKIHQGIINCIQYAEQLGFDKKSLPIQELTIAKEIVQELIGVLPSSDEKIEFLKNHYKGVQQYIQTVKWYIDALATSQQPNFSKLRVF